MTDVYIPEYLVAVKFAFVSIFWMALLSSCAVRATREEAIAIAYRYTQVEWMPEARHVLHGPDGKGIVVQTPDRSVAWTGDVRGWWKPGVPAKGMPYQWGGFDTPETFLTKIAAGKKAGDVGDAAKRKLGDAGTSAESCGIDCSGLVSRCWKLPRPYSTRELPSICTPLEAWDRLQPGDILLNNQHVLLFVRWIEPGKVIGAYEAGPKPVWRVNACGIPVSKLKSEGYSPWRYQWMK
ncbi:MAG: C40 family peptidase [Gloeobacteraceae cyanobacterium ES-bin-144]|nr:C40 family peptidase [Verrucomicrobiales bacterium]